MSEENLPMESSELRSNNDENAVLRALEDTVKLPSLPDITPEHLPTLSDSFARGKLAELVSFGGKSLAENTKRVQEVMDDARPLNNVYNRNHSEWTRRMINMDHFDPWFNMRQISAEMNSRRGALKEAKYRHMKNEVRLRRMFRDLQELEAQYTAQQSPDYVLAEDEELVDDLDIFDLRIEIAELQEGVLDGLSYIEGAMKEVLILGDLYEQLQKQINNFDEEDYEKHNARAHLRQAISQSLRDVRQGGAITKGEQRLLEQIGVNPKKMQQILQEYVNDPVNGESADDISVVRTFRFVCELADDILATGIVELKSETWGFDSKPRNDYMYKEKIALLDGPTAAENVEVGPSPETETDANPYDDPADVDDPVPMYYSSPVDVNLGSPEPTNPVTPPEGIDLTGLT
jgi:hypothetical protein